MATNPNFKPPKPVSRSTQLIAAMHLAALTALSNAPQGRLKQSALMQAIEEAVELNEWARAVYETTGHIRWRSIFAFASVGLVKAGYVTKERGGGPSLTRDGLQSQSPLTGHSFCQKLKDATKYGKKAKLPAA
jgi:hypothetical protein